MKKTLKLDILKQPDDFSCGPTCLHAIYRFHDSELSLDRLIEEVHSLEDGGTLAVHLGKDALRRGFRATIFTYNLQVFDPSWFTPGTEMRDRLMRQKEIKKNDGKLASVCDAYLEFLDLGGKIRYEDLNGSLIRKYLNRSIPILTGLSSTFLYRERRERVEGRNVLPDDVAGYPAGHFVVLSGYDHENRTITVADPYRPNPISSEQTYSMKMDRLINAILLGTLTYDANLLIIEPAGVREKK